MTRRVRLVSAALALVAMGFSFAEALLASTCGPMPNEVMAGMEGMSGMSDMPAMAAQPSESTGADGGMDGTTPAHPEQEPAQHDGRPDCPFGLTMGQGCSGVASLPASPAHTWAAPSADGQELKAGSLLPNLLLAHPLFRPPRA